MLLYYSCYHQLAKPSEEYLRLEWDSNPVAYRQLHLPYSCFTNAISRTLVTPCGVEMNEIEKRRSA